MMPRRTLQVRLAMLSAAVFFVAGAIVLAIPIFPLLGVSSTQRAGGPRVASGELTITSGAVDVHQLLAGTAAALAVLVPIAAAHRERPPGAHGQVVVGPLQGTPEAVAVGDPGDRHDVDRRRPLGGRSFFHDQ